MKRIIISHFIIAIGLFFISPSVCIAQDVNVLPNDPRVKTGTTANGLSYIVISNSAQKERAHFCIAQKVGTSLEGKSNLGSFLLLEQLATRGTRNFKGNSITDYLKKLGVGADKIIFSTQSDKLIYTIKDVPVTRGNTIDSSLLILYNWMSAINIDEDDLAAERTALRNRILVSQRRAETRLEQEQIRALYPKSPYTLSLDADNINSINSLNSRDLRNFYYTWCRPDLQCVIVVGDVDAAKVETQIKSIFATIPKPLTSPKREYYKIPKFDGVKSVILKDKEFNKTTVEIAMLKTPLKAEYRKTNLPYIQDYTDDAVFFLLTNRIGDGIVEQGLPIYDVEIKKGNYLNIASTEAYSISFQTLPGSVYSSISFISKEIRNIINNGFNKQEFNSTIDLYWKRLENGYDNRSAFSNDIYLQRGLNSYFEGYSLASTEMNFEIMKEILYSLSLKDLNSYAKALFTQQDNIVVCCKMPDAPGVSNLSESRLVSSLVEPLATNINSGEQRVAKWPIINLAKEPQIVEQNEDEQSGEKIFKLSNGATIVLKEAYGGGDTISFKAISKGGFSLLKGINIGNQDFFNDVLNISQIGGVSIAEMKRLYAYNHLDIESRINASTEEVYGWGTANNIERLLEGIYLNFTSRGEDKTAYEVYKQRAIYYTQYNSISPEGIFTDSVNYYNNSNKKFVETITPSQIESYNYHTLHSSLTKRFANSADFVFIFVGDNIEQYTPQIVKYIGNIPGNSAERESQLILPNYRSKGKIEKRFFAKMRVPSSFANLTYSESCIPNANTFIISQITEKYLNNYIKENFPKSVTKASVKGNIEMYPENIFTLTFKLESDSVNITKALSQIDLQLKEIASGKIDNKEWNNVIYDIAKLFKGERENREELLNYLSNKYINGYDFFFELSDLQSITKGDFSAFIKELVNSGNKISIVMDGTTADIETLRLLRENEFIRQYFDIQ